MQSELESAENVVAFVTEDLHVMFLVLKLIDSEMLLLYVRLTFEMSVMLQRWHVCEPHPLHEQEAVPT